MPAALWLLARWVFAAMFCFSKCPYVYRIAGFWMLVFSYLFSKQKNDFQSECANAVICWCLKLLFGSPDSSILEPWGPFWQLGRPWEAKGAPEGTPWRPESDFCTHLDRFWDSALIASPALSCLNLVMVELEK